LKLLILLKNAHISKLAASSVEKYYMALTEIELKICRFHCSLGQQGSRSLNQIIATLMDKLWPF